MKKTFAAAVVAAAFLSLSSTASAAATTTVAASSTAPTITSLTLTPPSLNRGKVYLSAIGKNVEKYLVSAECPNLARFKYGSTDICEGAHRIPAKRLKKLWMNLYNPNRVAGTIEITVIAIAADGKTESAARSVSLTVKAK